MNEERNSDTTDKILKRIRTIDDDCGQNRGSFKRFIKLEEKKLHRIENKRKQRMRLR